MLKIKWNILCKKISMIIPRSNVIFTQRRVQDILEKFHFLKGLVGGEGQIFFYLLSVCPHESFFFSALHWQNLTIKNFINGTLQEGHMTIFLYIIRDKCHSWSYAIHASLFREIGKLCLLELKLECFLWIRAQFILLK